MRVARRASARGTRETSVCAQRLTLPQRSTPARRPTLAFESASDNSMYDSISPSYIVDCAEVLSGDPIIVEGSAGTRKTVHVYGIDAPGTGQPCGPPARARFVNAAGLTYNYLVRWFSTTTSSRASFRSCSTISSVMVSRGVEGAQPSFSRAFSASPRSWCTPVGR